ncbi:hypothetical protein MMC11_004917 [Xylographa trunciseda]|nr:hypothetical protein [Xylographa trunciseda]
MAETQPAAVHEGVDDDHPAAPASAHERKAAAVLSSLENRGEEDDAATKKSNVDQKALGEAMSRLEVGGTGKTMEGKKGAEAVKKKVVKVEQGDVALLVEELDLTKIKATELLRAHEGDAVKAMRAFVSPVA